MINQDIEHLSLNILNEHKDFKFLHEIFKPKFLSSIPEQYTSVKRNNVDSASNENYINLPRFNNNNLILKTSLSNKRKDFFSYDFLINPQKKSMHSKYEKFAFKNPDIIDIEKKTSSLKFAISLYFLEQHIDVFTKYPQHLFLINKELNNLISANNYAYSNVDDLPVYILRTIKNLDLTDQMKKIYYQQIEKLIQNDKGFIFAHLFNSNMLYNLGLPIFTDAKHGYDISEKTLEKIHFYNEVAFLDIANSKNIGSQSIPPLSEPNAVSYTTSSMYLETLSTLSVCIPTEYFYHQVVSVDEITMVKIENDDRYSLSNLLKDFLTDKTIDCIEKDFSNLKKPEIKNLFLQSQIINAIFPYCKKHFEELVYSKAPFLEPKYYDSILKKIFNHRQPAIFEPRFDANHFDITIKNFPLTSYQLIMSDSFQKNIPTHNELSEEIYEIFKTNDPWTTVFQLNNLTYDSSRIGDNKHRTIDKFTNNVLPLIREKHLHHILPNQVGAKTKKKI